MKNKERRRAMSRLSQVKERLNVTRTEREDALRPLSPSDERGGFIKQGHAMRMMKNVLN